MTAPRYQHLGPTFSPKSARRHRGRVCPRPVRVPCQSAGGCRAGRRAEDLRREFPGARRRRAIKLHTRMDYICVSKLVSDAFPVFQDSFSILCSCQPVFIFHTAGYKCCDGSHHSHGSCLQRGGGYANPARVARRRSEQSRFVYQGNDSGLHDAIIFDRRKRNHIENHGRTTWGTDCRLCTNRTRGRKSYTRRVGDL